MLGPLEHRERALDDDLGLGARDERARIRLQRQPPEAPFAEDVRKRLARLAPGEQLVEAPVDLVVQPSVDAAPRRAEDVREDELGVDARRVDAGSLEAP